MKIVLTADQARTIADEAEAAWPEEACGLLVGQGDSEVRVTLVVPARNLLAGAAGDRRFELDPRVRFEVERAVRGTAERVVGHYHSHPDGSAAPSTTDLAQAWEPELIWLIAGVVRSEGGRGQVIQMLAHRLCADVGSVCPVRLAVGEESACKGLRILT